jgi:predicted DsbA family dithiol-disulfide isomerase
MIDPNTKEDGEEYLAYNQRRWGGDGWTRSLRALGARDGVEFANWATWPNTLHANRLLQHAESFGLGGKVKSILMKKIYEEGENASLREVVAKAADEAGVPGGMELVQSNDGMEELRRALQAASVNGKRVSSVPYYSVNDGALDFSGAQETKQWIKILEHFADKVAKPVDATPDGESC